MNTTSTTETIIKYSKVKVFWFILWASITCLGIVFLLRADSLASYFKSVAFILVGGIYAYFTLPELLNINKPQLILSLKGLQANDGMFYDWKDVQNAKIEEFGATKPTFFLCFDAPTGNRRLPLYELDKSPQEIIQLIETYKTAAIL